VVHALYHIEHKTDLVAIGVMIHFSAYFGWWGIQLSRWGGQKSSFIVWSAGKKANIIGLFPLKSKAANKIDRLPD